MAVDYEEGRRLLAEREAAVKRYLESNLDEDCDTANDVALELTAWFWRHVDAILNPDPWRPIEEAPAQDMACFVCRSKAVFTDYKTGQPSSFGEIRDWAEKCESAFWLNGQLHQAGTGHMYAEEDMSEEWQPTHWMPIPHFRELKGPGHV